MNAAVPPSAIGKGIYPLPVAAQLVQLDVRAARRWAEGYTYLHGGERRASAGLITLALPRQGKEQDVTFAELLTLRLVKAFRDVKLGLPLIRRVAKRAAADYGLDMPFASRRFRTDGRKVFIELQRDLPDADEAGVPARERELIEVLTRQRNFTEVVEPSLFANVDWDGDLASRWWPMGKATSIVLDPAIRFGAPRIDGTGVPTSVIAAAVRAEGGGEAAMGAVAEWYGVPLEGVQNAMRFETEWLSKAALPEKGISAVVTMDSRILSASIRREVWRVAGLTLFVMDGKWGNLSLFEQGRRLIWWWPSIAAVAMTGPQGAAWSVLVALVPSGLYRIFEDEVKG